MAITDNDLVKIGKVVRENINEALEEVVFPEFGKLEKKLTSRIDGVEKKLTKKIDDEIGGLETRLGRRIDNLAAVVTEVKTKHERRIVRLEEKAGFVAV